MRDLTALQQQIGERLRALREQHHLPQATVAAFLGVQPLCDTGSALWGQHGLSADPDGPPLEIHEQGPPKGLPHIEGSPLGGESEKSYLYFVEVHYITGN